MVSTLDQALSDARAARRLPPPETRRWLRQAAGLQQADLARELQVTPAAISRWETGARQPRRVAAANYARLLARLAAEAGEVMPNP
jgi:transcriptional regulator with XRE-family HTH domain